MALDPYALITLVYAKRELSIAETETGMDALLTDLINAVSERVEQYCNRRFLRRSFVEYKDGEGEDTVFADNPPITVHSLFDDLNNQYGSGTQISVDDFVVWEDEGRVVLDGDYVFADGKKNVKLYYAGGFSSVPADIQHGVVLVVAQAYKKAEGQQWNIASLSIGDKTVTHVDQAWPKEAIEIFDRYRLPDIG